MTQEFIILYCPSAQRADRTKFIPIRLLNRHIQFALWGFGLQPRLVNAYHFQHKKFCYYQLDGDTTIKWTNILTTIEVKATATIYSTDLTGLKKLKELTKDRFKIGIILYEDDHTTSFGENLYAVPIAALWR